MVIKGDCPPFNDTRGAVNYYDRTGRLVTGPPMQWTDWPVTETLVFGETVAGEEEKAREYKGSVYRRLMDPFPELRSGRICPWCSASENGVNVFHTGPCPRIKAIEYHPNGTIKRVEFNEG